MEKVLNIDFLVQVRNGEIMGIMWINDYPQIIFRLYSEYLQSIARVSPEYYLVVFVTSWSQLLTAGHTL